MNTIVIVLEISEKLRFHVFVTSVERSNAGAHLLPEAGATQERTLEAVRCSAWFGAARVQRHAPLALAQEPRIYGQVRGVMPFSCAYFAADASTKGRTSA